MKLLNNKLSHIQNISFIRKYSIPSHSLLLSISMFLFLGVASTIGQELEEKTVVPMDLSMMVPNIEVKINGKGTYRFDFDTGAAVSTISAKLAADLGLKVIGETAIRSPASDNSIAVNIVRVPLLSISDLQITEIDMVAMDLGDMLSVDGILGIKDFSDYLVTFNYPEKIVQFEEGSLKKSGENVIPFSLVMNGMVMNVEIQVEGTKKNVHFDTGFPVSFAFPLSMRDVLSFKTPPVESGTAQLVGTSFKIWKAQLEGNILLGNIVFESPEIILEDRSSDFITMGNSVLKDFAVTIDQKNSLLKFEEKTILENSIPVIKGEESEFTGRYGGVRSITFENGDLYLQRDGGMKLKLESIDDNLYKMELLDGMKPMNELPKVRFDRNEKSEVYRITFINEDGTEEYSLKEN